MEEVLFVDEASEGAYVGGAVYVGVDEVDVRAAEALVWDVVVDDIVLVGLLTL